MTVLVTGATGMIGKAVVDRFLRASSRVRVLTRRPHRARATFQDSVEVLEWHPMTEDLPANSLAGIDLVIHLMGEPVRGRWNKAKRERVRNSRVVTTRKLADAITGGSVRFICASSFGVYPGIHGDVYDEATPIDEATSAVRSIVRDWELAAFSAHERGASVAILRIGMVAGLAGYPSGMVRDFAAGRGLAFGDGKQLVPIVDIDDVSLMVLWAAGQPNLQGAINCVAPSNISHGRVVERVVETAGRRPRLTASPRIARLVLGPSADYFIGSYNVQPRVALEAGYRFLYSNAEDILDRALAGQRIEENA